MLIGDIFFSSGTYLVEVVSLEEGSVWPLFFLDDQGRVVDASCVCQSGVDLEQYCKHVKKALSAVIHDEVPLHISFRESFFCYLSKVILARLGNSLPESLEHYVYVLNDGEAPFLDCSFTGLVGRRVCDDYIVNREEETEENSLKFSYLSPEELEKSRNKDPSPQLIYELSAWSDLARWWFLYVHRGGSYTVSFDRIDQLPQDLILDSPHMTWKIHLLPKELALLVAKLGGVQRTLDIKNWQDMVERITFLEEVGHLAISCNPIDFSQVEGKVDLGEWFFLPGQGFFSKIQDMELENGDVAEFLTTFQEIIPNYNPNFVVYPVPTPLKYDFFFDDDKNLHIESYLFEKGDLQASFSWCFDHWIYLSGKGFYFIKEMGFYKNQIIKKEDVGLFVTHHQKEISAIPGLKVWHTGLDTLLQYSFDPEKGLSFFSQVGWEVPEKEVMQFGNWVYMEGLGFSPRSFAKEIGEVTDGQHVTTFELESFIDRNKEDLSIVPDFFLSTPPIESVSVELVLQSDGATVTSTPHYVCANGIDASNTFFYGKYVYISEPQRGFFLLPSEQRLPDRYTKQAVVLNMEDLKCLRDKHAHAVSPELQEPQHLELVVEDVRINQDAKYAWELQLVYRSNLGSVSVQRISSALKEGASFLFTPAGILHLGNPEFSWLKKKSALRWDKQKKFLCYNSLEFAFFWGQKNVNVKNFLEKGEASATLKESWKHFIDFSTPEPPYLDSLKSTLRQYQQYGVRWLWWLYTYGLPGGLLCDEMGLGKTHQAMGLLSAVFHREEQPTALVICPTSVIYHWEMLLKEFLPSLKGYLFYGSQRNFSNFLKRGYHILLTSYGVYKSEYAELQKHRFTLVIFDEIQVAKNIKSQTHATLSQANAKMRLGLTGTPVENHVLDLYALFSIVVPGYFSSLAQFKSLFSPMGGRDLSPEKGSQLRKYVQPFLLRRCKSEVLTELPEKIEECLYCDFATQQRKLYQEVYASQRDNLIQVLGNEEEPMPLAHVFSLINALKKICNHPALYFKKPKEYEKFESAKWDLFLELFHEALDGGLKVVVFSQYLGMLDIFALYLKKHHIAFAEIRGSTGNRKEEVQRFAQDPECKVFLGSLQAAGVGIDLTAASVVIHYDRWWNPAKENQATDRVHRMGQVRGVQVLKFITKESIEEHIDTMIQTKLNLSQELGFDSAETIRGFSRAELIALLKELELR